MIIRAWLHSSFDGNESYVDFEVDDNASVNDINQRVDDISEQCYADESSWEVIDEDSANL